MNPTSNALKENLNAEGRTLDISSNPTLKLKLSSQTQNQSSTSNHKHLMSHWVNARQTQEERRAKYRLAKDSGLPYHLRYVIRDWTSSHVKLFLDSRRDFL